jgi:hypothetical protein
MGFCEHGYETSDCMKGGVFLDEVNITFSRRSLSSSIRS